MSHAKSSSPVFESLAKPNETLVAVFFVLVNGLCLKKKGEMLSNEPFAVVLAQ